MTDAQFWDLVDRISRLEEREMAREKAVNLQVAPHTREAQTKSVWMALVISLPAAMLALFALVKVIAK